MTANHTVEILGTAEAARMLMVDRVTLTRWVAAGKVPVVQRLGQGGAYLFSVEALLPIAEERIAEAEKAITDARELAGLAPASAA